MGIIIHRLTTNVAHIEPYCVHRIVTITLNIFHHLLNLSFKVICHGRVSWSFLTRRWNDLYFAVVTTKVIYNRSNFNRIFVFSFVFTNWISSFSSSLTSRSTLTSTNCAPSLIPITRFSFCKILIFSQVFGDMLSNNTFSIDFRFNKLLIFRSFPR